MITVLRLLLLVFALETLTFAQVATGGITGTVIDASGASVPKASVRIINEETGAARALVTDSAGLYVGTNLVPGKYKVEVSMPGFQNEAKIGLVLSLDQTMTVNFTIHPGEQKQVVTVVDRSEQLVEAATSSLGQVIEESQIRDLPLNGRSFQQLIGLSAGAQPGPQGRFSQGHHLNGGRGEGNAFLIDGLDISSHGNDAIRTFPSLEAIGEFKIITNSFTAEYGRTLSGVIATHIKSGTNEYHGTLFEFLRNKVLDARNFFAPTKPKYNFNQFGGSFGGPAIKDKLFFFGDFQATRIRQESPQLRNIPTPAMRNGDFSGVPSVIYDPTSTPRVPFPNNRIPQTRFDKPSALMFSLLPDPTQTGPNNFLKITGVINDVDAFDFRSDYNLNENNRLSVVGTYSRTLSDQEPPFARISGALITTKSQLDSKSISLNYTRVFGPSQVNELIVGWKRDVLDGPPTPGHQYEPDAGIQYLNTNPDDPNTTGFPLYLIPGYTMFGGPAGGPVTQAHNIPQITDNFSFNRGRHTFKTGAAFRFRQFNLGQNIWPRGLLVFLGLMTSNGGVGGDPAASALLGYPLTATRDFSLPWGERIKEYGFYFQDDFKASRRLTLNLGVRYDLYMPATEAYDRLSNFDIASTTMILANQNGVSASTLKTNKRNFSPHVGFAYLLTGDGRTVLRGGYGLGYLALQTGAVGTGTERLTTNQPFKVNYSTTFDFLNPRVRVSDGLLLPVPDPKNPSGDVNLHLSRDPTPYMQQWNLNIQRALPSDFLAEIAYAGSSGVHLTGNVNINQAPPGPTAPGPRSLITPKVNQILGLFNRESSIYHSLQLKIQRRFASGFYLLGAYTYSKAIDNGSFTSQGSDASSTGPQDARNWRAERGRSDFDFTHRFVTSYIYELPVGKGHRVLGQAPAVVDYLLGGWQINGITTLQSGNVFTPIVANPRTNAGAGGSIRPDRIGSGELPESEQSINKWFDKTAFVPQGTGGTDPYHFGNSGRNILRGPKLVNFDFSLFKEIPIRERVRLEFRSEFFNIFNTPAFNLPDRSVDTPLGGIITSARAPRQIQLALKLKF